MLTKEKIAIILILKFLGQGQILCLPDFFGSAKIIIAYDNVG